MEFWYDYILCSGVSFLLLLFLRGLTKWTDGRFSRRWHSLCLCLLMVRIIMPVDLSIVNLNLFPQIIFEEERIKEKPEMAGREKLADEGKRENAEGNTTGRVAEVVSRIRSSKGGQTNDVRAGEVSAHFPFELERVQRGGYVRDREGKIGWRKYVDYLRVYWPEFLPGLLTLVWLFGMVFGLFRKGFAYYRFERMTGRGYRKVENEDIVMLLNRIREEYGIRASVEIYRGKSVSSPYCTGWLQKKIVLPDRDFFCERGMEGRDVDSSVGGEQGGSAAGNNLEYILRHELTHIRRCDLAKKRLAALIQICHWFNPVVWQIKRTYCEDLEFICDECVTKNMRRAERLRYNRMLIEHLEVENPASDGAWLNRDVRVIGRRMMMNMKEKKRGTAVLFFAAFVIVAGGFFTSCGTEGNRRMVDTMPAVSEDVYEEVDITGDFNKYRVLENDDSEEWNYRVDMAQSFYHENGQLRALFFHSGRTSDESCFMEAVLAASEGKWQLEESEWNRAVQEKYAGRMEKIAQVFRGQDGNRYTVADGYEEVGKKHKYHLYDLKLFQFDERDSGIEVVKADCFRTEKIRRQEVGFYRPMVFTFADGNILLVGDADSSPRLMCFDRRTGKKLREYNHSLKKYYVGSKYIYMMNEDNSAFDVISEEGGLVNTVPIDKMYGLDSEMSGAGLHVDWFESQEDDCLYFLTPEGIFESDLEAKERKVLVHGYDSDMISYVSKNLHSFTVYDGEIYVVCGTPKSPDEDEYQIVKFVRR